MKRTILSTTLAWFIILAAIFLTLVGNQQDTKTTYKISINRIQNQLSTDFEQNKEILNNLQFDELSDIASIDILDLENAANDTKRTFFREKNIYKYSVIFMPIENTSLVVRYELKAMVNNSLYKVIFLSVIITIIYLFSIFKIIMIEKNIIKPIERISKIKNRLQQDILVKSTFNTKMVMLKILFGA